MASAVKAAGFAGLLRVFVVAFGAYQDDWRPYMYGLAVATMIVGSVLAVVQTDVKRMLAYSSIKPRGVHPPSGCRQARPTASRARCLPGGVHVHGRRVVRGGDAGVAAAATRRRHSTTSGLARSQPLLAFVFAVFLFAQGPGVPLTSGFFAKFYVLTASFEAGAWPLAVTAMISAVIAAYLYLRITVSMYMTDDEAEDQSAPVRRLKIPFGAGLALGIAFVVTLFVGFLPGSLADTSSHAVPRVDAPAK